MIYDRLVQAEGERAYLDRHLVYDDAPTKQLNGRTAYLSIDGFWCVRAPGCCARTCGSCRDHLRRVARSHPPPM